MSYRKAMKIERRQHLMDRKEFGMLQPSVSNRKHERDDKILVYKRKLVLL